jgi:hypothetical protein
VGGLLNREKGEGKIITNHSNTFDKMTPVTDTVLQKIILKIPQMKHKIKNPSWKDTNACLKSTIRSTHGTKCEYVWMRSLSINDHIYTCNKES